MFPAAALCFLAAALVAQEPEKSASLRGCVRDSSGKPVAAATVQLKNGGRTLTAKTDAQGNYRFADLPPASYTLDAEIPEQGRAAFGPFPLAAQQKKQVDLTLAAQPAFYDQPSFIVAGVADGANRGGHGSDAMLRSSEALTKAAASLGKESSNSARAEGQPDGAEHHHALAELAERDGKPLEAVREYQRAAELDASERNLFDWGLELMAHRAYEPALEVLTRGARQYPRSSRMRLALATAYYAKSAYDEAAQRFFEAADLNPSDPAPYLFLGKVQDSPIAETDGYLARMRRFAQLQPDNAWANYYYAAGLWKHGGTAAEVQPLVEKAVRLDPNLAAAHLQLGIILAAQGSYSEAIAAYQRAIGIDAGMEEAHYRLAQAYQRSGEKAKAQAEFKLHDGLVRESAARVERERREVQRFIIELRKPSQ